LQLATANDVCAIALTVREEEGPAPSKTAAWIHILLETRLSCRICPFLVCRQPDEPMSLLP
jgi:hypothetical protein